MKLAATCRLVVLACALAACTSSAPEGPASAFDTGFVGRWESTATSPEGIGGVLDLAEDGSCVAGSAVFLDGSYKLSGEKLSVRPSRGGDAVEETVSFAGDHMLAGGVEKSRVGGDATDGIVGTWSSWRDGGTAYERYTSDGRMSLRVSRAGTTRGSWSVADGVLTLTLLESSKPFAARRSGDTLTLVAAGDSPRTFRRAARWWTFP